MKIAWTTYPFAGLPGTAKRPVSVPAGDGRPAAGTSLPSERLGAATLRYLRTIEEMASEIVNMTGNSLSPAVDEDPGQARADAPGGSAIARGDVLVFFPGPASGRQDEDGSGELVVVKGMGLPGHAGLPEGSREEALQALAKDVAEALTRCGRGLFPVSPGNDPLRAREKFIISVDSVDGIPVPTVIRHAPSGVASVFNNNGGGELSDGAVPEEVVAIAGLLTGEAEDVPMERLQSAGNVPSGTTRSLAPQQVDGPEREDRSANTVSSLLSSPVTAMRDMGRLVRRFFAAGDGQGDETEMVDRRNGAVPPSATDGSAVAAAEGSPSVKVTFMGNPGPAPQVDAGRAPSAPEIAGKVAALSDTINGIITGSAPAAAPGGDDAEEMEAGGEGNVIVRESVRRAVAASFAGALKELTGMDGREGARPPGISLDERGLLKVDAAVLREALSAGKSETVRFVHDLTASLHDRIAYNPLAFAGLHAGRPEAALEAPSGKERASGDDTQRKVSFEKRLSEIRMLLKSSYELKDSFMQRKFTGRGDG